MNTKNVTAECGSSRPDRFGPAWFQGSVLRDRNQNRERWRVGKGLTRREARPARCATIPVGHRASMINWHDPNFVWTAVGTVASIAGLGVGIWVLIVAKDAKVAAEAARALARRRNLAEELDDVSYKLQQLGHFLQTQQRVGVQIRIDEILAVCKSAMTRWSDHLPEEHMNDIRTATTLIQSIAGQSAEVSEREPSPPERKKLIYTHLRASALINSARGEARKEEERENLGTDGWSAPQN